MMVPPGRKCPSSGWLGCVSLMEGREGGEKGGSQGKPELNKYAYCVYLRLQHIDVGSRRIKPELLEAIWCIVARIAAEVDLQVAPSVVQFWAVHSHGRNAMNDEGVFDESVVAAINKLFAFPRQMLWGNA